MLYRVGQNENSDLENINPVWRGDYALADIYVIFQGIEWKITPPLYQKLYNPPENTARKPVTTLN